MREPLGGFASAEGTARYVRRLKAPPHPDHFQTAADGLHVSSLGMGTAGDGPDAALEAALEHGLTHGLNLIDTAANYRAGRAEQAVGCVLHRLSAQGRLCRDEVVLVSKGGYLLPGEHPGGKRFSIEPWSLALQLRQSLARLGIAGVDAHLLHNPEEELLASDRGAFEVSIRRAFAFLEHACAEGLIATYGIATWHGLRVSPAHRLHLDLARLKQLAREVAAGEDHFCFVELPISVAAPEALLDLQCFDGRSVSPLRVAGELGLGILASAALGGARRSPRDDPRMLAQVARSLPMTTSALVGVGRLAHAVELTSLACEPQLGGVELAQCLAG